MNLLALRLIAVFVVGVCLGSFVNWAIYALAWTPRPISPWSRLPLEFAPRRRSDRVPIFGWLSLRREAEIHGRAFWLRPLLLEIGLGAALALLYWWEVARLVLIQPQVGPLRSCRRRSRFIWQYFSHVILLCWMLAASFIDIDEKIIPDEITVTGTLLGLLIATLVPMSLLPHVSEPLAVPVVGEPLIACERRPCDRSARHRSVAGAGDRRRAEGLAADVGHASPADVARDRAWLAIGCGALHSRREFGAAGAGRCLRWV